MRLIDADALRQAVLSMMPERSEVLLIVDNQPEGIVRCKDCQHQDDLQYEVGGKFVCRKGHGWNTNGFFCADGEPRKPKEGDGDG